MKRLWTIAFAILFASFVFAQNRVVVSPQAIVVNPLPTFEVDVFFAEGGETPVFDVGESVRIGVTPSEDAYVYLFDVRPNGSITQILPNQVDQGSQDNFVQAGNTRYFPPRGAGYEYVINPPRGLSKVIAVASKERLDTRELARVRSGGQFATSEIGQEGFAEAFSIVVRPVEQGDWVTDTALYYVGERPQAPAFGTLTVRSDPPRAEVYLDGDFIGVTPLQFGARPGRHEIRIERSDFESFTRTVNLRPGETADVTAQLAQVRRDGFVDFRSSPSGAEVYVDGNFVGTTPLDDVRVSPGQHQARFTLPGYEARRLDFSVGRGEQMRVDASLRQTAGTIAIQANVGGAQVFLDGRPAGTIPSGTGQLSLNGIAAGVHQVTVLAPGYTTYVTDVNVRPGETASVSVRQTPL